jgi:hypothetical protein
VAFLVSIAVWSKTCCDKHSGVRDIGLVPIAPTSCCSSHRMIRGGGKLLPRPITVSARCCISIMSEFGVRGRCVAAKRAVVSKMTD